jgi:hypothetical protein
VNAVRAWLESQGGELSLDPTLPASGTGDSFLLFLPEMAKYALLDLLNDGATLQSFENAFGDYAKYAYDGVLEMLPSTFVYQQYTSAAVWTVDHPLKKYPSVTIIDSAGTECFGIVNYISTSQLTVSFSAPFSGKCVLN